MLYVSTKSIPKKSYAKTIFSIFIDEKYPKVSPLSAENFAVPHETFGVDRDRRYTNARLHHAMIQWMRTRFMMWLQFVFAYDVCWCLVAWSLFHSLHAVVERLERRLRAVCDKPN